MILIVLFVNLLFAQAPPADVTQAVNKMPDIVPPSTTQSQELLNGLNTGKFKNPLYPQPNGMTPPAANDVGNLNNTANPTAAPLPAVNKAALGYKGEILDGFYEDFIYDPTDKRDPFSPYTSKSLLGSAITSPLQKFALDELKLIAIVWNVKSPKAMVLDPTGSSYIVLENDKIGKSDGYIAKIREGEVVIIETHLDLEGNKAYLTKSMFLKKK